MDYDALLMDIAHGNMQSLEELYRDMYSAVFAFTLSIVKNAATAADLTQDAFVQIYTHAAKYKPHGQGRSWMLRIARNLSLNHLRDNKRETLGDISTERPDEDDPFGRSEAMLMLQSLFSVLSVGERELVMLKASGYTHREIAGILYLPEGTVRWKYMNALKKLKEETHV